MVRAGQCPFARRAARSRLVRIGRDGAGRSCRTAILARVDRRVSGPVGLELPADRGRPHARRSRASSPGLLADGDGRPDTAGVYLHPRARASSPACSCFTGTPGSPTLATGDDLLSGQKLVLPVGRNEPLRGVAARSELPDPRRGDLPRSGHERSPSPCDSTPRLPASDRRAAGTGRRTTVTITSSERRSLKVWFGDLGGWGTERDSGDARPPKSWGLQGCPGTSPRRGRDASDIARDVSGATRGGELLALEEDFAAFDRAAARPRARPRGGRVDRCRYRHRIGRRRTSRRRGGSHARRGCRRGC